MSWFVPLGVRVLEVGNHCTRGSVTVGPVATSKLIYQQFIHNTSEVVNLEMEHACVSATEHVPMCT